VSFGAKILERKSVRQTKLDAIKNMLKKLLATLTNSITTALAVCYPHFVHGTG